MTIGPTPKETALKAKIVDMSIAGETPVFFYRNLIETLRTDANRLPAKDEFRDLYEFAVVLEDYINELGDRIATQNDYILDIEVKLRNVDPKMLVPKLTAESAITIDGREISLVELIEAIGELAKTPDSPDP